MKLHCQRKKINKVTQTWNIHITGIQKEFTKILQKFVKTL